VLNFKYRIVEFVKFIVSTKNKPVVLSNMYLNLVHLKNNQHYWWLCTH